MPLYFGVLFALLIGMMAAAGSVPWALPMYYAVASAVAFAVYAVDKSAAANGRRRVPENRLHLLALLGGWPGALAAQRLLRHKSRKAAFQLTYWATVMLNCAMLAWLSLPGGLRSLLPS